MAKSSKMTKTEMFINILYTITSTPGRKLSHEKLLSLLGNPSKANRHKLINELTQGIGTMGPILCVSKHKKPEDRIYKLNSSTWENFISAGSEDYFFLEAFKRLGKIINCDYTHMNFSDAFEFEGRKVVDLDRKFMYLSKIEARLTESYRNNIQALIKALLENKRVKIDYKASNIDGIIERIIEPLTLCQYRDDLYIMCYKIDGKESILRNYKVSRIETLTVLDQSFKYPSKLKWNPEDKYKNSSGIISGDVKKAKIKVFGQARGIFSEKSFFNNELLNNTKSYDEYECSYSNQSEFIGQLFVYGDEIEVISPNTLKQAFIDKALVLLKRNSSKDSKEAA